METIASKHLTEQKNPNTDFLFMEHVPYPRAHSLYVTMSDDIFCPMVVGLNFSKNTHGLQTLDEIDNNSVFCLYLHAQIFIVILI